MNNKNTLWNDVPPPVVGQKPASLFSRLEANICVVLNNIGDPDCSYAVKPIGDFFAVHAVKPIGDLFVVSVTDKNGLALGYL